MFKLLYDVRSKWNNFGLELEIKHSELEAIRKKHNDDPDECFKELLSIWLKKLDPKPTWESLVSALKSKTVGYEQLSEEVRQKHLSSTSSSCASMVSTVQSLPHTKPQHQESSKSEEFKCPCGKCDLISYLDLKCPKTYSKSLPRLSLSKLNDDDREDMIQKVSEDTASIIQSFADLLSSTRQSIKRRNITVELLVEVALDLGAYKSVNNPVPLLGEEESKLRQAKTTEGVLGVLREHMSFFNYEILGHIIRQLGDENDKKNFMTFQSQFKAYCQRKVFEVPPTALHPSRTERSNRKTFVVVCAKELIETLKDVKVAQRKIASLLGLRVSAVQLELIDSGSVILVFSIPMSLSGLFPPDPVTYEKLNSYGYSLFVPLSPTYAKTQDHRAQNTLVQSVSKLRILQYLDIIINFSYTGHYNRRCAEEKGDNLYRKC